MSTVTADDMAALTRAHALMAEATQIVHELIDAHPRDVTAPTLTAVTKLDQDAAAADRDITVVGRYLGLPR